MLLWQELSVLPDAAALESGGAGVAAGAGERMLRLLVTAVLLMIAAPGALAAPGWHHPLYLANGGYWSKRVRVDMHSATGADVAGAPVAVKVGKGPGQADLVGAAAQAVRVVDTNGVEVLFAIRSPAGELLAKGPIPEQSDLVIPAVCSAGGDAACYVYFANAAAWPVPDFLETSLAIRNGGMEEGSGASPAGWQHDEGDAEHRASWGTECAHTGTHSLKLAVSPGAQPAWISTRQGDIYIQPGAHYLLRGWVKAENVSSEGWAGWYIHVGNASDPMLLNADASGGSGSYEWKHVTAEFIAPPGVDRADVGTVLWGTGAAWFDDVTLACSSPPALTATAGAPETRVLTELGATSDWYDGEADGDAHWEWRFPVRVMNLSGATLTGLAQVDISSALERFSQSINENSIRVTRGSTLVPCYRIGSNVLFEARTEPDTAQTYYLYLSRDGRIPAGPGSDYAALISTSSNLVKNPSFELGQPLPEHWSSQAAPGVVLSLDTPGLFGGRAARIDVPPAARANWSGWQQDVPVQPGKAYLYSAWVKCQEVSGDAIAIYAHYLNAAGELCRTSQYADAGQPISGTHDWTLMSGVFPLPPDCVTFQLHLTTPARGTVWHDGVVLTEIVPATLGQLETRSARPSGLNVWSVNPIVKVFQDGSPPAQPPPARISAARNEKEPLQLAIRSSEPLNRVTVEVEPPTNAAGARLTDIAVNIVGYVPVDHPSGYYRTAVPSWQRKYPVEAGQSDGWPGWWPDPLLPGNRFDFGANTTQPVWITIGIPREAAAGDYAGKVRVAAGTSLLREVPFTVHVWNFALPDERHLPAIYDIRLNDLWQTAGKTMDQVRSDLEAAMSDHRLCPDAVYPDPVISYKNGVVSADFTAYDQAAERYFGDLKLPHTYAPSRFYGFTWGNPPGEFNGEKPYPGDYPYASADPSRLRPEYKAAYQACLRAYWDHMKARGWDKQVVLYLADEPFDSDPRIIAQLKALADMVHEVDPAIPTYVSTWRHIPAWDGCIDIWGIGHYGTVLPEEMAQMRAKGARQRFTTDGQMCIDTPYLAVERLLPHYCFKYGVEGYEFWGISWLVTYNPYQFGWFPYIHQSDQPGVSYYIRYPNGDGFLAYPGGLIDCGRPVSSIRLEQAREGAEDYEYLYLLRDLVAEATAAGASTGAVEAALRAADELVAIPNAGGKYSTQILPDPSAILAVREKVAAAIEDLSAPAK